MLHVDISKIKAFTYINTIENIFKESIQKLPLDYFFYSKLFSDNTRITLSNERPWLEAVTTKYYDIDVAGNVYKSYHSGCFLWPINGKEQVYNTMLNDYGISNQITCVLKHKDSCELFTYATDNTRKRLHNIYINNLDIINQWSLELKEKLNPIMITTDTDRYYNHPVIPTLESEELIDCNLTYKEKINQNLTLREKETLNYLALGYTAKKIAQSLQLSYRTIEIYIENLKNKLHCTHKYEIVEAAIKLGLIHEKFL